MKNEKTSGDKEKEQENIESELENPAESKSKRDEPKKHDEILHDQAREGLEVYNRSGMSIFLSAFTAGLEIGFSFLLICMVLYFFEGTFTEEGLFKLTSLVYPVGFIIVIMGKSILFTEQTSLLGIPVLNKKRTIRSLFKIWGIVIGGNLVGGYLIGFTMIWFGPGMGLFDLAVVEKLSSHILGHGFWIMFISAILAGWLMAVLSWVLTSAKDTISRILLIFLITSVMSFAGFHHSIVGSVEVFAGVLTSEKVNVLDYLKFESIALIGNALGGFFFVALLKYRAFVSNVG